MNRPLALSLLLSLSSLAITAHAGVTVADLEKAVENRQWNDAAQIASELLAINPNQPIVRIKGAYALFHKEYANSGLLLLSSLKPEQWKAVPEGQSRFAEITSLLQKKVPLSLAPSRMEQVQLESVPPFLKDEVRFTKGREAYEQGRFPEARKLLEEIPSKSRYFTRAHYLLGSIAVKMGNSQLAQNEFSKVFEPAAYEQSTELWKDVSTQFTTSWGPVLKISFDTELMAEGRKIGELSLLGMARVAYQQKDYKKALEFYSRFDKSSPFYGRATLEKIWTLLRLSRHQEAEKLALDFAAADNSFEAIEARVLRALVLADAGRSQEARQELENFNQIRASVFKNLSTFQVAPDLVQNLPLFLQQDIKLDIRLTQLAHYKKDLESEINILNTEDRTMFPVYGQMSGSLVPLLSQARALEKQFILDHIKQREEHLNRLFMQSQLIQIETYLEDREHLRNEFRNMTDLTEQKQLEHDRRLADLLMKSVTASDEIIKNYPKYIEPALEFRQSELLWELGNVTTIIGQATQDNTKSKLGDDYKEKAIRLAQEHFNKYTQFENRPQVKFFIGYALVDMGKIKEGEQDLEQYTKMFPTHVHVPDAYRILADSQFDINNFAKAENYYKKILEFPDSPIMGYAFYKIGWCAYNQKDYARTLLGLEKAIVWAHKAGKETRLLSLQREAEQDLIKLYAEFGDHRKAREYFNQFVPGNTHPWLVLLAKELDRIGQFEKSADLYKLLIAIDPTNKENVTFQASLVYGSHQLHRWPDAIEAAKKLALDYKPSLIQPQTEESPAGVTEKILREAVLSQQYEYKKRPTEEGKNNVAALDEIYFSLFGAWPTTQSPLYLHAHYLLEQKKEAEAAAYFMKHWTQYSSTLQEPLKEEALRNLIFALNQSEIATPEGTRLTENAQNILKYAEEYQKNYASTTHARAISFLRPAMYFKYQQDKDAIAESQRLYDLNPADDIGQRSFKNLRSTYYKNKDWEKTYQWSSALLDRKTPLPEADVADLKIIREESYFLYSESLSDDNKSADQFLKLAKDPSSQRLKEKSLYNAFIRKNKAGRKLEAMQIADELEKTYPKYEGLSAISGLRAALAQDAGDYEKAAPLLQSFIKSPEATSSKPVLAQAHLNAGLIAEALGTSAEAADYFKKYLQEEPNGQGVPEAKRALERLAPVKRAPALVESDRGIKLKKQSDEFDKRPLPASQDLAERIQGGGAQLERLTKAMLDMSADEKTSAYEAFEIYCRVPQLYDSYRLGILALADNPKIPEAEREELRTELLKIAAPLELKTQELAKECIEKSSVAEHDGTFYRTVLEKWGWQKDSDLKKKFDSLTTQLQGNFPWVDAIDSSKAEKDILSHHYDKGGTEESWYNLAYLRWTQGKKSLSRLTVVDAISRGHKSGRMLNLLAVIDSSGPVKVTNLYSTAGEQGSGAAWVNLAVYHLKGARRVPASLALRKALDLKAFKNQSEIASLVKELTKE